MTKNICAFFVTKKMNIALCDDSGEENEQLRRMINDYAERNDYTIRCDCFTSCSKLLDSEKYDLYFLDYLMPEMTGAQLAVQLKEKYNNAVTVCFLTSFEKAAVDIINKSIYTEAFLIKPVEPGNLYQLLDRMYNRSFFKRLVLRTGKDMKTVYPQDILYVEARNKVSEIYFFDTSEEFSYKLAELEEGYLAKNLFFRIHRSYIVNMMHVSGFNRDSVTMKNGVKLPMSKGKAFSRSFSEFNFDSFK